MTETVTEVTVRVPLSLRELTGGAPAVEIQVQGESLGQALDSLEFIHPGFQAKVLDGEAQIRRWVNIYVNDDDARFTGDVGTSIKSGDVISIVPMANV